MRRTYNYHTGTNGWRDIGYNFLITQDGQIFEGRGWDKQGSHAGANGNVPSIGVQIYIGGNQRPTQQAQQAVVWLYSQANARFGRTLQVKGHRDYTATSCPGDYLYNNWVKTGLKFKSSPPKEQPPKPGTSARLVDRVSVANLKSARFADPPKSGTPLGPYADEVFTMETALAKTKWLDWTHVDGHFGSATVGNGSTSGFGGTTGFQKKYSGASNPDGWLGQRELTKLFSLAGMNVAVVS